ncbi:mechanosensitive ion channel family protein [Natronolimnohabitans sp. A-GB9]|uniref:mechanosensitive ion channel family protein n=1 Tax=Natronolimnohabitans sp. A-GB9 TaxID=3069757 RepID=UPI0027B0535B|nr:mechanosensitive ion channel family protein [Natronolimnohabitans sp. A-GB9]MDQ2049101.1 mechanosensitive ion channel family protein [Natronolimnohabitans sp. A-GB9]
MVGPTSILPSHAATLRPAPIPRLQETYLSTVGAQILATLLLVALVLFGLWTASRLRDSLERHYGTQIAEAGSVVLLGSLVVVGVYLFVVIWQVTYILEYTLRTMAIDRWLAAQQLVTGAIAVTAYLSIRFVNRSIDKLAQTDALTKHQSEVAYHVSDVAIVGVAATMILTLWGIDLTNIFIGAGAITALVGLTARETLAAMLAGFVLLFARPFHVGDWIEVNETTGIVTDVTIFSTKIQTFDDRHVLVPNDEVTDSQLTNYSQNEQLRVDLEVGIDYDTDPEHARSVITDAVADLESVKNNPTPQVIARGFDDSSILLECRVWIAKPTMRRKLHTRTAMIEAIVSAFDSEGLEIPYPQRVHDTRDDGFPIDGPRNVDGQFPTLEDEDGLL